MIDNTKKAMSTADIEQTFLKINVKISLSVAVFMAIPIFEGMLINPPHATGVLLGLIAFIAIVYMLVMLAKYSKLSKKISRKSYWTMQFKDEYVDYVSGISQRFVAGRRRRQSERAGTVFRSGNATVLDHTFVSYLRRHDPL